MNDIKKFIYLALIATIALLHIPSIALTNNVISSIEVNYLPKSKREFDKKYLNNSQPVLFKGAALSWESSRWDLDFFAANFPEVTVSAQIKETLTDQYGPVETTYSEKKLKDYISDIKEKGIDAGYLTQFNILDIHPNLKNSLHFPDFYTYKHLKLTNIWIGPKGTKSKLHYDSDHNLFVQIYGKKIVTLISPAQSKNCYPTNITWYDAYSPVDVFDPDLTKYPLFKNVTMLRYELQPGDMLYIPKGRWHDIRSTENSISANLWWITWTDLVKEVAGQIKYEYIEGKNFDLKNSYLNTLRKNLGI